MVCWLAFGDHDALVEAEVCWLAFGDHDALGDSGPTPPGITLA
jgi:hypothetical protein